MKWCFVLIVDGSSATLQTISVWLTDFSFSQHNQVSNPLQHTDGLNKYTTYDVVVRPMNVNAMNRGGIDIVAPANIPSSTVSRRYSDFLWLYDRLHADRPGSVVPTLPEKQPVGRFSPTFVEERRFHLERFLRRVAIHPELQDCACFDTFLTSHDTVFQMTKQVKVMAGNTSGSTVGGSFSQQPFGQSSGGSNEVIKRWFAEKKTSLAGDLVRSPDDDIFEEIQKYISGLEAQMRNVSQQASGLVRKGKEVANGLFEFAYAFNLLGQSEADALGGALLCMGETAEKLSVLSKEQAEYEMAQFEEPLQDYIKTIVAVKLALQRRQEKRVTYSTCLSDAENKQQQFYKLRSQIGSEAKAYAYEASHRRAQEAADIARDDFCACSQRVLREVDRFKREKAESMRRTVLDYINLQVEYNKRMEEIWALLIPELEKVPALDAPFPTHGNNTETDPTPISPETTILQPQPALYYGQPPPPIPQFDTHVPPPVLPQINNSIPTTDDPSSMFSVQYRETSGL
jgi:sorting nexin-1/2